MPRPKKLGAPEPKRRSRNGCWQCKGRKVKCGEERPACINCHKAGQACDYSIRLNWDGRRTKRASYDGSSDNPASPTRGQRSFTIVNQIFKPDGHGRVPAQAPPEQSIKEESWNDDQATIDWRDEVTGSPTWTPDYQTARPFPGGHEGAAVQMDDSGIPPEQILDGVYPDGRPVQMRPRAFSSNHQFMSLGGHLLRDLPSPEDPGQAANVFSLPNGGDGIVGGMDDPTGLGFPSRRNTMATTTSFNGAPSSLPMRFHQQHHSAMITEPLTPATSSSYSDEETRVPAPTQAAHSTLSSPGNRRLSVKSLLSGPSDSIYSPYERAFAATANSPFSPRHAYPLLSPTDEMHFYGYDLGQVDEDTGKNDDQSAISQLPPAPLTPQEQTQEFLQGSGWGSDDVLPFDFRFGNRSQGDSAGRGGYYKEPVAIEIPRSLGTLPQKLQENPMNLLYFHHFLNHTARVLMPYDDVESNPFRIILPQMAVKNDHLLSLLLAYSASHRARLLQQKEPEMRMARWLQDIFPALHSTLNDACPISSTNLATAIMLASLEIISPMAFGSNISWQDHLNLARDLMRKRFPAFRKRKMHSSSHEDQVCSFLWSWFAYLDVLGSLSGGPRQNGSHFLLPMDQGDDPDEIDCIMGFTTRCQHLLSETADLARSSDTARIRNNSVDPSWRPPTSTIQKAKSLDAALRESLSRQAAPCTHIPSTPSGRNTLEMAATNEAFHWAALVQLHRRALGKPASHADVAEPVRMIMGCLARIRSGTAEMGMLFPMFTAGCEVADEGAREEVLGRFRNVERNGMTQIRRARELMESVWREGRPWETMLKNEFIG